MIQATFKRVTDAKRLSIAQQQSDFTSEGAPLPPETPLPVAVATERSAKAVSSADDPVPDVHRDAFSGEDR